MRPQVTNLSTLLGKYVEAGPSTTHVQLFDCPITKPFNAIRHLITQGDEFALKIAR
jgi:hypothetical protein